MAVRRARVHGRTVWLVRVQVDGRRVSRVCRTFAEARGVDAEFHRQLRDEQLAAAAAPEQVPTLRAAFELYFTHLESRGKTADSRPTRLLQRCLPIP